MNPAPARRLRQVLRGEEPGEIQLVMTTGDVVICWAHGLTVEEQMRTVETILWLLRRSASVTEIVPRSADDSLMR